MTSEAHIDYGKFVERRTRLNEHLSDSRRQLDAWIQVHQQHAPSLSELARFEGLLLQRREQLSQLLQLDDAFMNHLLLIREQTARGSSVSVDGHEDIHPAAAKLVGPRAQA